MAKCILDKWLQNQVGHPCFEGARIDLNFYRECVLEAEPLNVEVQLNGLYLFRERHLVGCLAFQAHAKERAQIADHVVCGGGVRVNERRNQVERVEEEMGLQLALEDVQLCFRQLPFELGRVQPGIARAKLVVESIKDADDDPVHPDIPGHTLPEKNAQEAPGEARYIPEVTARLSKRNPDSGDEQQGQHGECTLRQYPEHGPESKAPNTFAEEQDQWCEQRPDCVGDDRETRRVVPSDGLTQHRRVDVIVDRQQRSKEAPRAGDYGKAPTTTPGAGCRRIHESSIAHSVFSF